jgi:hypothetical protein
MAEGGREEEAFSLKFYNQEGPRRQLPASSSRRCLRSTLAFLLVGYAARIEAGRWVRRGSAGRQRSKGWEPIRAGHGSGRADNESRYLNVPWISTCSPSRRGRTAASYDQVALNFFHRFDSISLHETRLIGLGSLVCLSPPASE